MAPPTCLASVITEGADTDVAAAKENAGGVGTSCGVLAETAGACTAGKPVVDKGKGQPRAQDVTNVGLQLQRSMSQERLLTCSRTLLLNSAPTLSNALAAVSQSIAAMISDEKRACGKTTLDISLCDEAFSRLNAHVSTVLAAYAQAGNQDWRQYAAFNAHHYVRHLLDANDDYELLLLCWGPQQVCRIHSHASSHCWFTLLSGSVVERRFQAPAAAALTAGQDGGSTQGVAGQSRVVAVASGAGMVAEGVTVVDAPGQVAYISDKLGLHSVGCAPGCERGAITLHLYAPPIQRVWLYSQEDGSSSSRVPGFNTIRGQPM